MARASAIRTSNGCFEGFAFLMARLRHKLDDELPELTEGVVSMLWPHYLRMIPSLSILEITPASGALQCHERLPAGLEALSAPHGETPRSTRGERAEAHIECVYRTTQPVDLYPLSLDEAKVFVRDDGRPVLRIRFQWQPQARREQLNVPRLRIYLHGERPVSRALYGALVASPVAIHVRVPDSAPDLASAPLVLSGLRIEPAGFSADERLWPKPDNAFGGYQLLLEYFTFAEKFMFVDLLGLDLREIAAAAPGVSRFDVEIALAHALPDGMQISADNLRLFCTPVINLFALEADPVSVTQFETEYRVQTGLHGGHALETYSVDAVHGFESATGKRFEYVPFAAFRHRGGMLRHETPERYFHTRARRGPSGRIDTWLVLGGRRWESSQAQAQTRHPEDQAFASAALPRETLSLTVTGTHGMLPRKALRDQSIARMRSGFANVASIRNLTAPTSPVYPPTGDRFHWRVLSHLAPNYLSLLDADILRGTLALYDWTDDLLNRRKIDAIRGVRHRPVKTLTKGCVLRGVEIEVTLDATQFAGDGDIELFGAVLNRFMAMYATLNVYTKLIIVTQPDGRRIAWPEAKAEGAPF